MNLLSRVTVAARAACRQSTHRGPTSAGTAVFWACVVSASVWLGSISVESVHAAGVFGGPPPDKTPSRSNLYKADTSRSARHAAIQSIPFEKLPPEARRKVSSVLSANTLFRRMPVHATSCDRDVYLFMVRHPDVLVGTWEELGVSELRMAKTEPDVFHVTEGKAAVGTAEFLYRDDDMHIVYCEGEYHGPLLGKPIRGRSLLILTTDYVSKPNGRYSIVSRLDTFTDVENATVEFLTRTFQPLVGRIVDNNFLQTSAFVGSLSRTMEVNHRGVQRLASNLNRVKPEVRKEFALLARQVAQKSSLRQASHQVPVGTPVAAEPNAARY
ncbi:MAG: hypothetical protein JW888_12460 [Pirellulales bacterium]|nr:hypothetical protein [Pirellulales bacterium]